MKERRKGVRWGREGGRERGHGQQAEEMSRRVAEGKGIRVLKIGLWECRKEAAQLTRIMGELVRRA